MECGHLLDEACDASLVAVLQLQRNDASSACPLCRKVTIGGTSIELNEFHILVRAEEAGRRPRMLSESGSKRLAPASTSIVAVSQAIVNDMKFCFLICVLPACTSF